MEAETTFRAMGSDVHVIVVDGSPRLLETAREFVDDLEDGWSRFRPNSEISRMNAVAGFPARVSAATLALVQRAVEGARVTGGRYDPTVLGAVLRAGYYRTFELLTDEPPRASSSLGFGYEGIEIDPVRSTVTLPWGVGFDPGGIGKGYAADLLVDELLARGAAGACANVGGDLRVAGRSPQGGSWVIDIDHPMGGRPAATVSLRSGPVATSSRMRRTWGRKDDRRHHMIDPSTGVPATGNVASATVVAAEAWEAEVAAKAAFIAGVHRGVRLLESLKTDGLLIDLRGSLHRTSGFDRFALRGAADEALEEATR